MIGLDCRIIDRVTLNCRFSGAYVDCSSFGIISLINEVSGSDCLGGTAGSLSLQSQLESLLLKLIGLTFINGELLTLSCEPSDSDSLENAPNINSVAMPAMKHVNATRIVMRLAVMKKGLLLRFRHGKF